MERCPRYQTRRSIFLFIQRPSGILRARPAGFTLIELMLVAAIMAVLASIAMPKFADMVVRTREARVLGGLGALRSALSLYYADNEGFYPKTLYPFEVLTSKYIDAIPNGSIPAVASKNNHGHHIHPPLVPPMDGIIWDIGTDDVSGYEYDPEFHWGIRGDTGVIFPLCTHLDSKGKVWSSY